jgi:hypothetical protein
MNAQQIVDLLREADRSFGVGLLVGAVLVATAVLLVSLAPRRKARKRSGPWPCGHDHEFVPVMCNFCGRDPYDVSECACDPKVAAAAFRWYGLWTPTHSIADAFTGAPWHPAHTGHAHKSGDRCDFARPSEPPKVPSPPPPPEQNRRSVAHSSSRPLPVDPAIIEQLEREKRETRERWHEVQALAYEKLGGPLDRMLIEKAAREQLEARLRRALIAATEPLEGAIGRRIRETMGKRPTFLRYILSVRAQFDAGEITLESARSALLSLRLQLELRRAEVSVVYGEELRDLLTALGVMSAPLVEAPKP